jgi:hypothetical protein
VGEFGHLMRSPTLHILCAICDLFRFTAHRDLEPVSRTGV